MHRVILIDNEPWILEGMAALIPWQAHGFAIAGAYTDPVEAYEAILRDPPELAVVDIRMPEMDGLTLIHKARAQGVQSAFVIVSGYSEFEYAHQAMAGCVLDYLLKPIDPEEMGRLLSRLSNTLAESRAKARSEALAALHTEKDFRRFLGQTPKGARFAVARMRGIGPEGLDAHLAGRVGYVLYPHGEDRAIALFSGDPALREALRSALAAWMRGRSGTVGRSAVHTDPLALPEALDQAEAAELRDFLDPSATLTLYRPPCSDRLAALSREVFLYFLLRQAENLSAAIRRLPAMARENGGCMDGDADFWNGLAALVNLERGADSAWRGMRSATAEGLYRKYGNIGALCDGLEALLGGIVRKSTAVPRTGNADERFFDLLGEVSAHYEKKLSLHDLADRYRLNISHCCKLFKRVTGGTFSDYLIRLRMERAHSVLRATNLPASEVYALVGYSDYYYFRRSYQKYCEGLPDSTM